MACVTRCIKRKSEARPVVFCGQTEVTALPESRKRLA